MPVPESFAALADLPAAFFGAGAVAFTEAGLVLDDVSFFAGIAAAPWLEGERLDVVLNADFARGFAAFVDGLARVLAGTDFFVTGFATVFFGAGLATALAGAFFAASFGAGFFTGALLATVFFTGFAADFFAGFLAAIIPRPFRLTHEPMEYAWFGWKIKLFAGFVPQEPSICAGKC